MQRLLHPRPRGLSGESPSTSSTRVLCFNSANSQIEKAERQRLPPSSSGSFLFLKFAHHRVRVLSFPGGVSAVSDGVTAMEEASPLSLSLRRCEHRRRAALLHAPSLVLSPPSPAVWHLLSEPRRHFLCEAVEPVRVLPSPSSTEKLSPLPYPFYSIYFYLCSSLVIVGI